MTLAGTAIGYITSQDHRLMRRIQRWRAPRWVRLWMIAATRAGDGWIWYALALALLLFGGPQRFDAVTAASAAALLGVKVFLVLKKLTGRKRPCVFGRHCWADLIPPDQFSFPSGHSITAFAVTVPLILFYPSLTVALLFCAGSIATSRFILGMHFLSDVVAGCVIGSLLGYAGFRIVSQVGT